MYYYLIHPTIQLPQAAQAALAILQPSASAATRGERKAALQDQADRAIDELVCREAQARARHLASRLQFLFRRRREKDRQQKDDEARQAEQEEQARRQQQAEDHRCRQQQEREEEEEEE